MNRHFERGTHEMSTPRAKLQEFKLPALRELATSVDVDHDDLRNPFCHIVLPVTVLFDYCRIVPYVLGLEKEFLPIQLFLSPCPVNGFCYNEVQKALSKRKL